MNKMNGSADRIKTGLGVALAVALTGCVGYVGPGGGPDVVVDTPGIVVGGVWEGGYVGRDVAHGYGDRGRASRGFAHGGGGRGGGRR